MRFPFASPPSLKLRRTPFADVRAGVSHPKLRSSEGWLGREDPRPLILLRKISKYRQKYRRKKFVQAAAQSRFWGVVGAQIRVLGAAAIDYLEALQVREGSSFAFPADLGEGHFVGVVRVLGRVCAKAKLKDVTPHVLHHAFASVAGDLGFSELTIAGLLGHSARGVTQGYVHLDAALVVAPDRVSAEIAQMLDGGLALPRKIEKHVATAIAA